MKNPQSSAEMAPREMEARSVSEESASRKQNSPESVANTAENQPVEYDPSDIITEQEIFEEVQEVRPLAPIAPITSLPPYKKIKSLTAEIAPQSALVETPTPESPAPTPSAQVTPPRESIPNDPAPVDTPQVSENEPYFEIPPFENITYQSPEVHEFLESVRKGAQDVGCLSPFSDRLLAALSEEATFSDSS